jgi:hypothetical protein
MKLSLLTALIILALAALIGWQDHRRLVAARESHARLLAEATALGVSTAGLTSGPKPSLPGKTSREGAAGREADARDFAARLAKFALAMDARQKEGKPGDEEFTKEMFDLLGEMLRLDAPQLKTLIAELRINPELSPGMRRNIVGFAITMLAEDHPAAALAIFTGSSDLFGEEDQGEHVISNSLSKWAEQDPAAALAWVRENADQHPGLVTEDAKRGLVGGAAKQDPRLAFQLIGELALNDMDQAGAEIGRSAATPAQREAVLAALREHRKAAGRSEDADSLLASTIAALGGGAMKEGFESAAAWFDGAGLDETEAKAFTNSLSPWHTGADTGKWIEWMAAKAPAESLDTKVPQLMEQWTKTDYQAAGVWLSGAADGPAKQAAVKSYARTVAPYDPAAAEQWARTLPAGRDRDGLLEEIAKTARPNGSDDLEWTDPD